MDLIRIKEAKPIFELQTPFMLIACRSKCCSAPLSFDVLGDQFLGYVCRACKKFTQELLVPDGTTEEDLKPKIIWLKDIGQTSTAERDGDE